MQFRHTMESGLQSNEVRIPKTIAGPNVKTTAFTHTGHRSRPSSKGAIIAPPNPPDFDLGSPCQYFKSSFARSLSMHSHQTKSLDFGVNLGLARSSTIREIPLSSLQAAPALAFGGNNTDMVADDEFDFDCSTPPPPPLPLNGPPSLPVVSNEQQMIVHSTGNGLASRNILRSNLLNKQKNASKRRSFDSTEIEVLRLRKECQNLVEENRRLLGFTPSNANDCFIINGGNSRNIEAVVLQNQVDTLQWQLKQVEASREMYRAVMEEVVRFLERCHRNLDSMQNEQMARSKNAHYLCRNEVASNNGSSTTSGSGSCCETDSLMAINTRPLSSASTSLIMDAPITKSLVDETLVPSSSPAATSAAAYNNFRDFTWHRSPRRNLASNSNGSDFNPEKLSQEAFRLLRTAQNLLNTQEPELTVTKPTSCLFASTNPPTPLPGHVPPTSLQQQQQQQQQNNCHIDTESFSITFSRKLNTRESRSSLRSSTDGSVHSTTSTSSSSKTETDEELLLCHHQPPIIKEGAACSTEDESGFSSISSFQEIGLPLHSTLISNSGHHFHNGSHSDDSCESGSCDLIGGMESRNSTLKATQTNVGLIQPPPSHQHHHRRWESAPAIPPRRGLHLFSGVPGEESSSAVLWV